MVDKKYNWNLVASQFALFFHPNLSVDFDQISFELKQTGIFNKPVSSIFPFSPSELKEVNLPILDIKSEDNIFNATVNYQRADLFFTSKELKKITDYKSEILDKIKIFTNYFTGEKFPKVERLGFVLNFFSKEAVVKDIANLMIKKISSQDMTELHINWNIKDFIANYESNHLVKLEPAKLLKDNSTGIMQQRDINTVINESYVFSIDEIVKYVTAGLEKFSEDKLDDVLKYE